MDKLFSKYNDYQDSRAEYERSYREYFMCCTIEDLEHERENIRKEDNEREIAIDLRKNSLSIGWEGSLIRRFEWSNASSYGTK